MHVRVCIRFEDENTSKIRQSPNDIAMMVQGTGIILIQSRHQMATRYAVHLVVIILAEVEISSLWLSTVALQFVLEWLKWVFGCAEFVRGRLDGTFMV
jgi:hypothetical protein